MLSLYSKQSTQLKNKIHGELVLGTPSKHVISSLKRSSKNLKREMEYLEKVLNDNVKR